MIFNTYNKLSKVILFASQSALTGMIPYNVRCSCDRICVLLHYVVDFPTIIGDDVKHDNNAKNRETNDSPAGNR